MDLERSLTISNIHTLLEGGHWKEAEDLLQTNPGAAKEVGGMFKSSPLVTALMHNPPVWIVVALIEKNPKAVCASNDYGMLPLRVAIRSKATLDVIDTLLRENCDVAKTFGVSGKTCLHLACLYNHHLGVIERLLETWPEAAQWTDRKGWHPLHLACLYDAPNIAVIEKLLAAYPEASMKFDSEEHLLPLHIAAEHCATPECIKLLHDAYPQGIKLKTKKGFLPLHLACQKREVYPKTIAALLELYPDASKEAANDGSLPLHLASQSGCSMSVLKVLFEANPHGMIEKNNHGDTPFACAEGKQTSQRNLSELERQGSATILQ